MTEGMSAATSTSQGSQMETRASDASPRPRTPNCVKCSHSLDHAICTVLHLRDSGWVAEQRPRRDEQSLPTW
jgi:hypothetical protein